VHSTQIDRAAYLFLFQIFTVINGAVKCKIEK